ncbi:hypothetical protein [Pseudomonas citronellolis]|uniref:hypothetical protein n=1 Tax=Pseudomonas citronellolis TaxID=53408 RepID=UPI00248EC7B6|nr:hypothetical protein [Pseudomonas citronellolis]
MAYQTGVTSSLSDLISTLLAFADANGFDLGPTGTYTGTGVSGSSGTFNIVSLVKNGIYYLFAQPTTGTTYLWMNTASSYAGGSTASWTGVHASWCRVDNLAGPHVGYHMFSDGSGVNVAVEIVTNVFAHFNFGELQKNGDYDGGQYVTGLCVQDINGTSLNSIDSMFNYVPFGVTSVGGNTQVSGSVRGHVRTPVSGPTSALDRNVGTVTYNTAMADNSGRPLIRASPNAANGRAVLVPITLVQASNGMTGPFYQLGYVGNARCLNIANLQPKEVVNTDWMVFPVSQKNGPATTYINSANYGIAYRK